MSRRAPPGGAGYTAYTDTSNATMNSGAPFCRNNPANVVRLPSNDVAQLRNQINGLTAGGNTSITLGMKWGVALIEPGARVMFNELVSANAIPAKFRGRPYDWNDPEAMKVIVLMTDGEHVAHTKTNDAVKTGVAPIWRSRGDGNWSVLHSTRSGPDQYWVPHRGRWQATPWNSGGGVTQQNWAGRVGGTTTAWVAWQLYARALERPTARGTRPIRMRWRCSSRNMPRSTR